MAVESPPWANQNTTLGAEQFRRAVGSLLARGSSAGSILGGVGSATDCQLTPPGSGMTVVVNLGEVWVPGSSSATQSGYYCRVSSNTSLTIAASDPTNPRIDRVVAVVTDSAYSGVTNTFAVSVVTGTPTAGATLVNLTGAGAAPASSYTLGYVLVPALATNIVSADIANVATPVALGLLPGGSYGRAFVNGYAFSTTADQKIALTIASFGNFDTTNNWFLAPANGLYHIAANVSFNGTWNGTFSWYPAKNGSLFNLAEDQVSIASALPNGWSFADMIKLNAGDTVSLRGQVSTTTGSPQVNAFLAVRQFA